MFNRVLNRKDLDIFKEEILEKDYSKEVAEQVHRVLKPKGKFIISSDININNDFGEFIKPEILIDIVESSGLKLKGTYDKEAEQTDFHIPYNNEDLQVVCLVFEK